MKRLGKQWFFIVAILIFAITSVAFFGIKNYFGDTEIVYFKSATDIRWGIDIQGGVEAVFAPSNKKVNATEKQLEAAREVINTRLVDKGITDYETSVDTINDQIIVRFPWQSGEEDYDAASAISELGNTAELTFCTGSTYNKDNVILKGSTDVATASAEITEGDPYVLLKLTSEGKSKFASATANNIGKSIAICLDEQVITAPTVNDAITDGTARITGPDYDGCVELANTINAGSLPFAMTVDDSKLQVISATLGGEALNSMLIAGVIAFVAICALMIVKYRLSGVVASIGLIGQVGGMIACVSGLFPNSAGLTLTIPGIAGIILSVGMGVDANVITSERIAEEIRNGKTVTGAIESGSKHALSAIVDGNITNVLVAVVLMGCFGPTDSVFSKLLSPIMGLFGASVSGAVYSFGYTLLMGVIFNFIMGVFASKLMLKSISGFKALRKPSFYGGAKNVEE